MNKHTVTTFSAFAAACFAGSSAFAGTPVNPPKQPAEVMQESCITGDIGFDVVSNYVFHGIVQENQGFIIQPYANLHFRIYQGSDALSSITADIGIWNSFQSHRGISGPGSTTSNWYEFDFQAGLTFNINKFAASPYFKVYESPADAFQNAYTAGLVLSYDDKELLGDFSLRPYVLAELNLDGTTGNNYSLIPGSSFHGRGQYYEVGVTPAYSWGDFTLSLPLKGGFGTGGYYLGNRGFGFFSAGLDAAYDLKSIPSCLGKWTVRAGATYYRLGGNSDNLRDRSGAAGNAPASLPGNGLANNDQWVFSGGLKVAF
jgi:hypothetical protein